MLHPAPAPRPSRRGRSARYLGAIFLAALVAGFVLPLPSAAAAPAPKVAVIVGPSGAATADNRRRAIKAVDVAKRYTPNVVRVFSPNATWDRVRAAMSGASVVLYFGRGRGFPSPYGARLDPSTMNGFGLNPKPGVGNSRTRYYGESSIRRVPLARNAVVLLHRVPYASGTGPPGAPDPGWSAAKRRADNYGAGFLAAGAAVVIGEMSGSPGYYITSIFTRTTTLAEMWRQAPTVNGHSGSFPSVRTPDAQGWLDPVAAERRFDRSIVGHLGVRTSTVLEGNGPHVPPPSGASLYGSAINADSLNNSVVGGPYNRQVAYRFRATTTSELRAIRIYLVSGSGYSAGTGGTLAISLQEDDGTAVHAPSGRALAEAAVRPGNPIAIGPLPLISFPAPPTVVAGRLYHVVFRNIDPAPTANYVSVDGLFTFGDLPGWQPGVSRADWANLIRSGGGPWSDDRGPGSGVITPILALTYANGVVAGVGYMEVWVRRPKSITGLNRVRQTLKISGPDRTVESVSVRVKRVSGSGPLKVRLEDATGALVGQGFVPASRVSTRGYASWVTVALSSPRLLRSGRTYRLVLTSERDTTYSVFGIREGGYYGFAPSTFFADGHAQHNPGSGWVGFDQPGGATDLDQADLQFYFR